MKHITPKELKAALDSMDNILLVDVREQTEREKFNIGGEHVPLGEIMEKCEVFKFDATVVVYCKMGIRSQIAIQRLQDKFGYNNLVNLKGGMEAWKKECPDFDTFNRNT